MRENSRAQIMSLHRPNSNISFTYRIIPTLCTLIGTLTSIILLLIAESDNNELMNQRSADNSSTNNESTIDDLTYGAKFWLCVHVGCGLALSLHTRGFADQRYSFTDRLYYSYAFSLVVLLPAR